MKTFIVFDTSSLLAAPNLAETFAALRKIIEDAQRRQKGSPANQKDCVRVIIPGRVLGELKGISEAVDSEHHRKAKKVLQTLEKAFGTENRASGETTFPFEVQRQRRGESYSLLLQYARNPDTHILACAAHFVNPRDAQRERVAGNGEDNDVSTGEGNEHDGASHRPRVTTQVFTSTTGPAAVGAGSTAESWEDEADEDEVWGQPPTRPQGTTTTATNQQPSERHAGASAWYAEHHRCMFVSEDQYMHIKAIPYKVPCYTYEDFSKEYGYLRV